MDLDHLDSIIHDLDGEYADDQNIARDARGKRKTRNPGLGTGWIGKIITILGKSRRHAMSLNKHCEVVITNSYPLRTTVTNSTQLINQLQIASQQVATKAYGRQIVAATPVDVTISLAARVFGVRVRITDSDLNFKKGSYTVQLLDGSNSDAVMSEALCNVNGNGQVDIVLLAIQTNGGEATIIGTAQPKVKFVASGSDFVGASTALYVESLNLRDLGVLQGNTSGAIETA